MNIKSFSRLIISFIGRPITVSSKSFGTPLKASATGYFQCDGTMEITLGEVTLEVKNLRFQAFHKTTSGEFSGGE